MPTASIRNLLTGVITSKETLEEVAETFLEALVWFLVNKNKTSVGEGELATGHEDQADENKVISLVKPSGIRSQVNLEE